MPEGSTLAGRVCVLAGGSGGIGAVLARALHGEGAPLVIGYRRDRERAETLAAELRASGSAPVSIVGGDLAHEDTRAALRAAASALGIPYGLVVLAGDPARPATAGQAADPSDCARETAKSQPVMNGKTMSDAGSL